VEGEQEGEARVDAGSAAPRAAKQNTPPTIAVAPAPQEVPELQILPNQNSKCNHPTKSRYLQTLLQTLLQTKPYCKLGLYSGLRVLLHF
jgi:hypothetical protein